MLYQPLYKTVVNIREILKYDNLPIGSEIVFKEDIKEGFKYLVAINQCKYLQKINKYNISTNEIKSLASRTTSSTNMSVNKKEEKRIIRIRIADKIKEILNIKRQWEMKSKIAEDSLSNES